MFPLMLGLLLIGGVAHAATLEIPTPQTTLSGIGVVSGWKCAAGDLTVRFDGGPPLPLVWGSERKDVRDAGACDQANVGFVTIMNWGNLGDGQHTAVVYDDGVEFDRSTFDVVTTGEAFLRNAAGQCVVEDFPAPGEEARFIWNQATQHMELAEVGDDLAVSATQGACVVGMILQPEQSCTAYYGHEGYDFTFSVDQFSYGCLAYLDEGPPCEPEAMWRSEIGAERNQNGSWTIARLADPTSDDHGDTLETATVVHLVSGERVIETGRFSEWYDDEYFVLHVPAGVQGRALAIFVRGAPLGYATLLQVAADGTRTTLADEGRMSPDPIPTLSLSASVSTGTYYLFLDYADYWDVPDTPYEITFQLDN